MSPNSVGDMPASIKSKAKKDSFKCDAYFSGLFKNIELFYQSRQLCDVTLIAVDGWKVEAHRMVLCAASKYFLSMFNGSDFETNSKDVQLEKVDGHTLTLIIDFIYTGSIDLETYTLKDYLAAARLFESNLLEEVCFNYMSTQIGLSSCLEITSLAEEINNKTIYETAETYVCQHFMDVRGEDKFFQIGPNQLCKFLSSDELCVPSEEEVFHSIMSWVEYDRPKREQFICMLLNSVRFPFLFQNFILNTVERVCKCSESRKLIIEALKWHLLPDCRLSVLPKEKTQLRNCKDVIFAIGGWKEKSLNVGLYMPAAGKWIYKDWPGLPEKRTDFGSTTVGKKLIIAGGCLINSGKVTNRVDCLDMRTLQWTQLSELKTPRRHLKMVTLMGQVYAIGGFDGSKSLTAVEKLDHLKSEWKYVAPIPADRQYWGICAGNKFNSIYVESGFSFSSGYSFTYNPIIDKWKTVTIAGSTLGIGTVRNLSTECFTIVRRSSIIKYELELEPKTVSIPEITDDFNACIVFGNRFIVYGNTKFQEYYPFEDKWKPMPSLSTDNDFSDVLVFTC